MRYVVIETDGTIRAVETEGEMPLQQLQALVGGYIEATSLRINGVWYDAFCNEEGKIMEPPLPPNALFPVHNGPLILGHATEEGGFVGVNDDELTEFDGQSITVVML